MTDQSVIHTGENSPVHVASKLMQNVMSVEKRSLSGEPSSGWTPADRAYLLDLYAECLRAVQTPLGREK